MPDFEKLFAIPADHELEQVRSRSRGGAIMGIYWTHSIRLDDSSRGSRVLTSGIQERGKRAGGNIHQTARSWMSAVPCGQLRQLRVDPTTPEALFGRAALPVSAYYPQHLVTG